MDDRVINPSLAASALPQWGLSRETSRIVRLVEPYVTFTVRPDVEFDEDGTVRPSAFAASV